MSELVTYKNYMWLTTNTTSKAGPSFLSLLWLCNRFFFWVSWL